MKVKRSTRSGQTTIMLSLAAVPLFGILGLAVDVGWAYFRHQAAQAAADSAAVAAAMAAYTNVSGGSLTCGASHIACYSSETPCPTTFNTTPADNIEAGCMYAR